MQMHVKIKRLAYAGVCLAISMILILIESVFGVSTLFLLSLSGFLIGIIIREFGLRGSFAYLIASIMLAFFIAPDKLKILTYSMIEIYIYLRECCFELLLKNTAPKTFKIKYFLAKLLIFNVLFIPAILLFPEFILTKVTFNLKLIAIGIGQIAWLLVDEAYDYFQLNIWNRIRDLR